LADIDIDVQTSFNPTDIFNVVQASMIQNGIIRKHPVGVYFQNIPQDPISKLAAIPYEYTDEFDYFKVDFLHLSILDMFDSKQQIRLLLKKEPDWELLKDPEIVSKLFQIAKHYEIINSTQPRSVNDLADCIALIRPGKRYLLNDYIKDKYYIRNNKLYVKERDSDYKKSHAVAYANIIVLQLHLIKLGTI
jgi:DNA polymerase III alpha subunit